MKTATGLNNIPTEEQNHLCNHWAETRRSLEILARLVDGAGDEIAHLLAKGEEAVRKLQKGQPSRRRSLLSQGPHTRHR